ncbi:MAG: anaerobic ribonucleoside-triphosphate reductase activating protein [Spirochaetota bacterium]
MAIRLVGLQKTTLIDFPGEVAATVFLPGCNLRCPYCQNPDLVVPPFPPDLVSIEELTRFLNKRKNVLGGVCISGGEPLIHKDLPDLIHLIRDTGLKVKIDTNGSMPGDLSALLAKEQIDYVAMDIKTAPRKYIQLLAGKKSIQPPLPDSICRSIRCIVQSGISHEFRTTVVPGIVTKDDVREIAGLIQGAGLYVLAGFQAGKTLNPAYETVDPYPLAVLEEMKEIVEKLGIPCKLRPNLPVSS